MSDEQGTQLSRRSFLKIAGLAGAAVQAGGLIAGGVAAGSDTEGYTGWESFNPATQFFNREPFRIPSPAHTPVGEVRQPSHITDYVFGRVAMFEKALVENPDWTIDDPVEDLALPPPVTAFYNQYPERMGWDYKTFTETIPNHEKDDEVYGNYFMLAEVYSSGFRYHSTMLRRIDSPPEVSDFTNLTRGGPAPIPEEAVPFKSPELATELVKELAHRYGATQVGITKPQIDFFYGDSWQGVEDGYDHSKLPEHWKYAIVIGVPMEWDQIVASPQFTASQDAYNRVSTAAIRIEGMLKSLGYAARANTPNTGYDCLMPPHAIEAGLGEVGRTGFCITPESGGNSRMAMVVTNLELVPDSPIDFGVEEFCNKCKICAESCPSGAISMADSPAEQEWGTGPAIRGYEHWYINNGACYNYWRESMGNLGCRHCVGVCPYSRKDNWMHNAARELDPRDPTGVVSSGLLWMQKNFFDYPEAIEYKRPAEGGRFAVYGPEPAFMDAEKFLDVPVTKP
ncbi:MAG: reductive dehalogenase [Chloroflexi bacterium]|nr:MAG: reductive dehalogenase [Chloroflexota bacterium]MBL1194876.1 reductive dehalogenase [Chloroflexota bacterium]NOH12167.1 reductive dehalogenase [Chloroflexota bacterium]